MLGNANRTVEVPPWGCITCGAEILGHVTSHPWHVDPESSTYATINIIKIVHLESFLDDTKAWASLQSARNRVQCLTSPWVEMKLAEDLENAYELRNFARSCCGSCIAPALFIARSHSNVD